MQGIRRQVLHVDDDPQVTRIIGRHLERYGYDVVPLNEPHQCLEELMRGQYRAVLLDIDMPRVNGVELLRDIKRYDGGVQVIMLTCLVTMNSVLESLRCGAEACFFKPMDDVAPLAGALDDAFRKLDRWWDTLDNLLERRRAEGNPTAP